LFFGNSLMNQLDGQAIIKEGDLLQTSRDAVIVILGGFKDLWICPEPNLGTSTAGITAFFEFFRNSVVELLVPVLTISLDFCFHARRQRVHHRNTNTVQTTRDSIRIRVELTASV